MWVWVKYKQRYNFGFKLLDKNMPTFLQYSGLSLIQLQLDQIMARQNKELDVWISMQITLIVYHY